MRHKNTAVCLLCRVCFAEISAWARHEQNKNHIVFRSCFCAPLCSVWHRLTLIEERNFANMCFKKRRHYLRWMMLLQCSEAMTAMHNMRTTKWHLHNRNMCRLTGARPQQKSHSLSPSIANDRWDWNRVRSSNNLNERVTGVSYVTLHRFLLLEGDVLRNLRFEEMHRREYAKIY